MTIKIPFNSIRSFYIPIILSLSLSLSLVGFTPTNNNNLYAACVVGADPSVASGGHACDPVANTIDRGLTDRVHDVIERVIAEKRREMLADGVKRSAAKAKYKSDYSRMDQAWRKITGRGFQNTYKRQINQEISGDTGTGVDSAHMSRKIMNAFHKTVMCEGLDTLVGSLMAQSAAFIASIPPGKTCTSINVVIQTITGPQTIKYIQHRNGSGYLATGPQLGKGGQKTALRAVKLLPLKDIAPFVFLSPNAPKDAPDLRMEGDLCMRYKTEPHGEETLALNDSVCEDNTSPPPKADALTMKLFESGDGASYAQTHTMSTEQVLAEAKRLLSGLDIVQRTHPGPGSAHCDIKLENMFVDGDGHYHLADFGFLADLNPVGTTARGCRGGTAGYIPPEGLLSFFGGPVFPPDIVKKGDVFATAISLYRMRFKVDPPVATAAGQMYSYMSMNPPPPPGYNPLEPGYYAAIIQPWLNYIFTQHKQSLNQ